MCTQTHMHTGRKVAGVISRIRRMKKKISPLTKPHTRPHTQTDTHAHTSSPIPLALSSLTTRTL